MSNRVDSSRILDTNWTGMCRVVDDDCACGGGDDCQCFSASDDDTTKEAEVKRIKRGAMAERKRAEAAAAKAVDASYERRAAYRETFIDSMTGASQEQ